MKLTREIKTAILVIASISLFIWGYSFLKGKDLFESYQTYYVEYASVEGLGKSAPVTLNGLVIGKVNGIHFSEEHPGKLVVELQVKSDFPISKSSTALMYEPGLIAGKQIMIEPNLADKNLATSGSFLTGGLKPGLTDVVGEKVAPLQAKLDKILTQVDQMLTGINNVLDKQGQENLKKSLSELSATIAEFHKTSQSINQMMDQNKANFNGIAADFKKTSGNFAKISDSLQQANLGQTVKNLQSTMKKVDDMLSEINQGKGTAGKLVKDEALYNNLSKSTKELELLLQDLRLNPTRYINVSLFGKKNKPYVAPKENQPNK